MCISVVVTCLEKEDRARFMYLAHQAGMTTPDYVYLTFNLLPDFRADLKPWLNTPDVSLQEKEAARSAYLVTKQVLIFPLFCRELSSVLILPTLKMV